MEMKDFAVLPGRVDLSGAVKYVDSVWFYDDGVEEGPHGVEDFGGCESCFNVEEPDGLVITIKAIDRAVSIVGKRYPVVAKHIFHFFVYFSNGVLTANASANREA